MGALRCVRSGFAVSLAVAAGLWTIPAIAATPSGQVIAVIQSSEADSATGRRTLQPEAPVFSGDTIITGPVGEAQIRFRDDTRLVVGPNSQMVIDAFVFSESGTARDVSINAVKGAFRFITGTGPKDAYTITTPTASIGVRGTEFDVDVEAGTGTTRVVNFSGITRICRRNEVVDPAERDQPRCVETRDPCGVSIVRPQRNVFEYRDPRDRNRELNWYFRYVRDQSNLLSDFRVDTESCGSLAMDVPPPSRSEPAPPPPPPPPEPPPPPPEPPPPPPPPPPDPPPCEGYKCKPDEPDKPHKPGKGKGGHGKGWGKGGDGKGGYGKGKGDWGEGRGKGKGGGWGGPGGPSNDQ